MTPPGRSPIARTTSPSPRQEAFERVPAAQLRVVSSAGLLGGDSTVAIEHGGKHYILRATRTGKLILTK